MSVIRRLVNLARGKTLARSRSRPPAPDDPSDPHPSPIEAPPDRDRDAHPPGTPEQTQDKPRKRRL